MKKQLDEIEKLNLLYGRAKPSARAAITKAVTLFGLEIVDENTGEYLNTTDLELHLKNEDLKTKNNMENSEKKPVIFAEGITAFNPHEKAPEFRCADVIINPEKLMEFIKERPELLRESKYGKQIKLQLNTGKNGTLYFAVDQYGLGEEETAAPVAEEKTTPAKKGFAKRK